MTLRQIIVSLIIGTLILYTVSASAVAGEESASPPKPTVETEIEALAKKLMEAEDPAACGVHASLLLNIANQQTENNSRIAEMADRAVLEALEKRKSEEKVVVNIISSIGIAPRYSPLLSDRIVRDYFTSQNPAIQKEAVKTAAKLASNEEAQYSEQAGALRSKLLSIASDGSELERFRLPALEAVSTINKKEVLEKLVQITLGEGERKSVLRAALKAVKEISNNQSLKTREDVARWWEENKNRSIAEIREQGYKETLEELRKLRKKHAVELIRVLENLKKTNPAEFHVELKKALESPENRDYVEFRIYCAKEAGLSGKKDFVAGLLATLGDENPDVKKQAALALGEIGVWMMDNTSVVDILFDEFELAASNGELRGEIAVSVGMIGGAVPDNAGSLRTGLLEKLYQKLCEEMLTGIQARIITAIGETGMSEAAFRIRNYISAPGTPENEGLVLKKDLDLEIRKAVSETLGKLEYGPDSIEARKAAVQCLVKMLATDGNPTVRVNTAKSLGNIRAREALDELVKALNSDPDKGVKNWIVYALGKIGDLAAVEPIVQVWKTGSLDDKNYVLPALRDIVRLKGLSTAVNIAETMKQDEELKKKISDFLNPENGPLLPEDPRKLKDEEKTAYYQLKAMLGDSYVAQRKWESARKAYLEADEFFKNASIKEKLADCYQGSGDYAAADAVYGELLKNKDATPEAKRAWWAGRLENLKKLAASDKVAAIKMIDRLLEVKEVPENVKQELLKLKSEIPGEKTPPGEEAPASPKPAPGE